MVERWQFVAWSLAVVAVAYSYLIAGQLPLGVFAGALVYLIVWWFAAFGLGTGGAFGPRRAVVTATVVVLVVGYSFLIASEVLLGLLAASSVFVVAWVTSPTGPFADDGTSVD